MNTFGLARYFDCIPILIEFVKEMTKSEHHEVRQKAFKCLRTWDKYRDAS